LRLFNYNLNRLPTELLRLVNAIYENINSIAYDIPSRICCHGFERIPVSRRYNYVGSERHYAWIGRYNSLAVLIYRIADVNPRSRDARTSGIAVSRICRSLYAHLPSLRFFLLRIFRNSLRIAHARYIRLN